MSWVVLAIGAFFFVGIVVPIIARAIGWVWHKMDALLDEIFR